MHVLIVKVSSLGDVIHTLPALTDARRAIPDITFDWVTEEAFTEIPAWHPAVNKVIPVAFRRWRKNILSMFFSREYRSFKSRLKATHYDLIIDAQGLIKSGLISSIAKGKVTGLDKNSAREKLATRFYDQSFQVDRQQHAVERTRQLFAKALGYKLDDQELDYGLSRNQFSPEQKEHQKNLIFLHGTTWSTKLWPEKYWAELGKIASKAGYQVKLPWGNEEEQQRAHRLGAAIENAEIMSRLSLSEIATQLLKADFIVAVDTGLAHLAAALNCPTVALYGASDANKTGTYGHNQVHLSTTFSCSPCLSRSCSYQPENSESAEQHNDLLPSPPCFSTISPEIVWQHIESLRQPTR